MSDYWHKYWKANSKSADFSHPHKQVQRVFQKQEISDELFDTLVNDIINKLEISAEDLVLDLCAGNGMITEHIAAKCKVITAVDFSEELINEIKKKLSKKIVCVISDITQVNFEPNSFDKILLYAGLQYLDEKETVELLKKYQTWLKPGGIVFIGDIPDIDLKWNFFNNKDRETSYFNSILNQTSIIGTWFNRIWLVKAAEYSGFKNSRAISQPENFIYSHFRFDLLLNK